MIRQKKVIVKTATATLTLAEMGDIFCDSASAQTYTLPTATQGLWYRLSNINTGEVTVSDGSSTLATLVQGKQCIVLNDGSSWFAF